MNRYDKSSGYIDVSGKTLYKCQCDKWEQEKNSDNNDFNPKNICYNKFKYFNLFPTKNNFLVKGRNLNQDFTNNLNDEKYLKNISNKYNNVFKNVTTNSAISNDINRILEDAPLKLSCCNTKDLNNLTSYNFKVPLNPNNKDVNTKQFDYQYQNIKIPPNSCPTNYNKYNSNCNAFMNIYCDNMYKEFKKLNLEEKDFTKYSPECGCYAPDTKEQKMFPLGIPSKCYKNDCIDNTISYLNPNSQNQTCSTTICQNIVNAVDISAGGAATLSSNLVNNCGPQIDAAKQKAKENENKEDDNKEDDNKQDDNKDEKVNQDEKETDNQNSDQGNLLNKDDTNIITTEEETFSYTIIYVVVGIVCCIILIIIIFYFMSSGKGRGIRPIMPY